MNALLYARVSTGGQTADQQLSILRDLAARRGWEIAGEYVDLGHSTRKGDGPEWIRLLKDLRAAEIVLVVRLDRLARSTKHLIEIGETLEARNVQLVCAAQDVDTTSPSGRLLFRLLGSIAEFERDLISVRTKEKLSLVRIRLRAEGRDLGRPPIAISEKARRLWNEDASISEIARRCGVSRNTARKWCEQLRGSNPVLKPVV